MPPAKTSPLRRLLRYARSYRRTIWVASFYSIINKIFDLAPPLLIGAAVDIVVSRDSSFVAELGVSEVDTQLWILAGVTLAVWACESVFEYAFALKWRRLAQRIQHVLRLDAYRHVQDLDMAYFEDRSTGGMMAVLNDDVNQLERFLDTGANELIQLATTVVVVGGVFFVIVPSVAWMAIVPMPIIIWGSIWFQRRLEPKYADVRARVSDLNAELGNNLTGIATIKSFVAEEHEAKQLEAVSTAYENANREAIRLSAAFVPLIRMSIVVGFAAILVYGGKLALSGDLNVGAYSILVYMTQRLLWPLTRLGAMLDQYQRAMASTTRVLDVLDTKSTIDDGHQSLVTRDVKGRVSLDNVDFRYSANGPLVLRGLSVTIEAGHTVAFVGGTGAGKSSIVKLLLRFYDTTSGNVMLDDTNIKEIRTTDLRKAIGLVSQDVFLFHGTVRENIAYGTFDASDEAIRNAAKIAEAHEFITALPNGYDTIVGERGQKLSGGQRQRISIARAVLKDPPLLILDEATSSVDNETEAAIQRSLERIAIDRTTILIAHRLSTVRNANQIFVLEHGKIIERGTHDELTAIGGLYAALWRVQTGMKDAA